MRTLFTSIALATLACTTPAMAEPAGDSYSVAISYADLNLANPAGIATFQGRVRTSADRACVGVGDSPLQQSMQVQKCRAQFFSAAQQQLRSALAVSGGMHLAAR